LEAVTPLTGDDPNLGSFFLVVGVVTCVFIAVFQFTLPDPISFLLTAGTLLVTILSAIVASLLETLGYFDESTTNTNSAAADQAKVANQTGAVKPWVPTKGESEPLPPMINFDDELQTYYDLHDGDLPDPFDEFISEYKRLKTASSNRRTIASDMRTDLNPISVLYDDGSKGAAIYDEISDRLFRYIDSNNLDHLSLDGVAFFDDDGKEADVPAIAGQLGRIRASVSNEGDAVKIELYIEFVNGEGTTVDKATKPMGVINPGATKPFETKLYVPSIAKDATVALQLAPAGTQVADL
jgi:hypothetical protein